MKVDGSHTRTIWVEADGWSVGIVDQTLLPHRFATVRLASLDDAAQAIRTMVVRGAPLIGAAAAYGVCLALREDASDAIAGAAPARGSLATRPTAINLDWALDQMGAACARPRAERVAAAFGARPADLRRGCRAHQAIGRHGLALIGAVAAPSRRARRSTSSPTAMPAGSRPSIGAPRSRRSTWRTTPGSPVHVWVDETRPRNQGAAHRVGARPARRAAHGDRRQCRRSSDAARRRSTWHRRHRSRRPRNGDVCNKIGTY